jgi:6-phosphogluconolactonase
VPSSPPFGDLRVVADVPTAFAEVVATEFGTASDEATSDGTFRIALSGGDTARACYEAVSASKAIDWRAVECFLGDERCVAADDPAANQRLVRESLLDRVGDLPAFHPIDWQHLDAYAALLRARPPLDIVHLGLGPDGHTASLFPGSEALEAAPDALVVLNEDPSGRNPHPRVTFTFAAIARSRLVVFTVAGAAKHGALAGVLAGEDLPAARVRARRVLWLCDAEALEG